MAYPSDFQETLVAAASAATDCLHLPNQLVDCVFTQYSPNYSGALGATLNINIPTVNSANATDIGNGGITGITPADTKTAITINHKWDSNRLITHYDDALSPNDLAQIYISPVVEEVVRKVDAQLTALVTAGNFTTNGTITGGADTFTRAHLGTAWGTLDALGVPTDDPNNFFLVVHSTVYGNMMGSSDFANESVVGINSAQEVQQRGILLQQFNALLRRDPQLSSTSGLYAALMFHRYAIGLRTVTPVLRNDPHIATTVIFPKKNLPVVLEMWREPKDQGVYINAYSMCGYAVVRENLGQYMQTT